MESVGYRYTGLNLLQCWTGYQFKYLIEVLLEVVEGVLRDISNAQVGVLPDGTRCRLNLASQDLDEG